MNSAFSMPTQQDIAASENMFLHFWNKGYRRIIGIVPPNAPLAPESSFALRIRKNPDADARGKAPGMLRADGLWEGVDFTKIESRLEDMDKWQRWRCGVGLKTGRGLLLIDADTRNPRNAKIIEKAVREEIGVLPLRIGQAPKAGYLVRIKEDFKYRRIEFGALRPDKKGNMVLREDRVEILSDGRQFVAWGTHPKTMLPYAWPDGIPDFDDIPFTDEAALVRLLNRLREELPNSHITKPEGSAEGAPDQKSLLGVPETVRRIVSEMPNTSERFPSREDYLRVGYAIKAAMGPEHEYEAQELFIDWAMRWDDPEGNDPDVVRSDWNRLVPPFRVGAPWLYDVARAASGGALDVWMDGEDAAVEDTSLFPPEEGTPEALKASGESDVYLRRSITDLFALPDAKYLIDRHVSDQGVGILFGAPGTGKSFVTLDMALSIAFGLKEWQGHAINADKPLNVLYLAGEGARGYKARVMAWMQERGIDRAQAGAGRFDLIDAPINFMKPEDVAKLIRTIRTIDGDMGLVVVDTVSRVIPGADENLQKDMTLFVESCRQLETRFHCPVLGVHHTNKAGEIRGSSVFEGAGDFMFRLDRKKGERVGRLYCHKMKDGSEDGWDQPYRFDLVSLADTTNPQGLPLTSLVISRCTPGESAELGGLTPDKAAKILKALADDAEAGEPWSLNARAKDRCYVRQMVSRFEMTADVAEQTMEVWLGEGRVIERQVTPRSKAKGLFTVSTMRNAPVEVDEPNVFE